jgi:molybdate/tungstate transport system permease protein
MTLTFARAISEFAAVAILAYYPMSAPVKIYELFLQQGLGQSAAAALLLLVVSLALFLVFRLVAQGRVAAGIGR